MQLTDSKLLFIFFLYTKSCVYEWFEYILVRWCCATYVIILSKIFIYTGYVTGSSTCDQQNVYDAEYVKSLTKKSLEMLHSRVFLVPHSFFYVSGW